MDIKQPKKIKATQPQAKPESTVLPTITDEQPTPVTAAKPRSKKRWLVGGIVVALLVTIVAACAGAVWWYNTSLQPVSTEDRRVRVTVKPGSTIETIAGQLVDAGVIKNKTSFRIYLEQSGKKNSLQAGAYLLSPHQSVQEIVEMLASGKVDVYNVTILPGKTLMQIKDKLIKDGFQAKDIDAAFAKKYDHPLFEGKPADVPIEGYIFPETYQAGAGTTVEQVLMRSFDEFYKQIQAQKLVEQLKGQNLSLFQGIILASIIQTEAPHFEDQAKISQVFLKRYREGMVLGSDVTYMYIAKQTGQVASPNIDSPYNTRKYPGFPPSAIANFNIQAIKAAANPAPTDYLYFVAGDDGTVYYSHTEQEHEDYTAKHCTRLCQ